MKLRRHKFGLMLMLALTGLLICAALQGQSPEKMSYQAVIRNTDGVLLTNQNVGIRIQILQSSEFGAALYLETHTRPTNANGLVTLEIGEGSVVLGSLSGINWSDGPYFLKTEIDPAGGTNYSIAGTTQLLSVPYALHAKESNNLKGSITESQISDLKNYLTDETDPVFNASPAQGITGSNITNWNSAFGWGNHSGLYRPVSWVPSWTDVTAKPTEFPPSAHSHSAADINSGTLDAARIPTLDIGTKTSGTLSVARGGTGATTFTSGNVLIGGGTGAITTLSRSGIDTRAAFTPAAHIHAATDITSGTLNIARIPAGTTSSTVSLGNHTHGNITSDGRIGTTAARLVMTGLDGKLGATGGTSPGQILYWTSSGWALLPPGSSGQVLTIVNGVPTWQKPAIPTVGSTDVYNHSTGKVWMDRNLGATRVATSSTDASAYGHLYQWGRSTDGHQFRTSSTTTILSSSNTPGHASFILAPNSPYDWRSPQNTNLWWGVSGVNNPCPAGYRLPTEAEWNAERLSWSTSNAAGAFASPLKLPVAGFRYSNNGSLSLVGTNGLYWSSTVSSTISRRLAISSSDAGMGSNYRAYGLSVRCLKD